MGFSRTLKLEGQVVSVLKSFPSITECKWEKRDVLPPRFKSPKSCDLSETAEASSAATFLALM